MLQYTVLRCALVLGFVFGSVSGSLVVEPRAIVANPPSLSNDVETSSSTSDSRSSTSPTQEQLTSTVRVTASPTTMSSRSFSASRASTIVLQATGLAGNLSPGSNTGNSSASSIPDPNGLPYTPRITPGNAVMGIFLLLAGIPYTMIGVRYKQLQVFLSSAFLISLGVATLIVYLMNPPISKALEGGYVAASTIAGLIVGGLANLFPEITEYFGAALGGICLSMWLLVLQPGGLIKTGYGKIILILSFTGAMVIASLYRLTRPYAMIFSIAFSGATAIVLGLDCFTRSGLKEFWLYVWNINDNIFPLYSKEFPHTRGIKVEIAVIVIITLIGIVSQMKLWRVIKEKRIEREIIREEEAAYQEAMEIENGSRLEQQNRRSRMRWEAQYADKSITSNTDSETINDSARSINGRQSGPSQDSGIGQDSMITEIIETDEMRLNRDQHIQMQPLEMQNPALMKSASTRTDIEPTSPKQLTAPAVVIVQAGSDKDVAEVAKLASQNARASGIQQGTVIIPAERDDDDASSFATAADSVRDSRRLSHFSTHSMNRVFEGVEVHHREDDQSSLAATYDRDEDLTSDDDSPLVLSDDESGGGKRHSMKSINKSRRASLTASIKRASMISMGNRNSIISIAEELPLSRSDSLKKLESKINTADIFKLSPLSAELSLGFDMAKDVPIPPSPLLPASALPSPTDKAARDSISFDSTPQASRPVSRISTVAAPLKRESLQSVVPPSRALKTFRTHEWAKQAQDADIPDLEDLEDAEAVEPSSPLGIMQGAAPVHVYDLQEGTSSPYVPPPALSRSASQATVMNNRASMMSANRASSYTQIPTFTVKSPPASIRSVQRSSTGPTFTTSIGTNGPVVLDELHQSPIQTNVSDIFPSHKPMLKANPSVSSQQTYTTSGSTAPTSVSPTIYGQSATHLPLLPSSPTSPYKQNNPYLPGSLQTSQSSLTLAQSEYQYTTSMASSAKLPSVHEEDPTLSQRRAELRSQQANHSPPIYPNQFPAPIQRSYSARLGQQNVKTPSPKQREEQMKQWRESLGNDQVSQHQQSINVQSRRLDMLAERNQKTMMERHRKLQSAAKETVIDERMKQQNMLSRHAEAMRKMQANAKVT